MSLCQALALENSAGKTHHWLLCMLSVFAFALHGSILALIIVLTLEELKKCPVSNAQSYLDIVLAHRIWAGGGNECCHHLLLYLH